MKIGNSSTESVIQRRADRVTGVDSEVQQLTSGRGESAGADSVRLSSGNGLIALARASFSSAHVAKVRNITSQINAGLYQADSLQTSQAVVDGHLRG